MHCRILRSSSLFVKSGLRATPSFRKHGISADQQHEVAFEMAASNIRFGEGVTKEVGFDLKNMGANKVLVFTDANLAKLEPMRVALDSLTKAQVPFEVYDRNGYTYFRRGRARDFHESPFFILSKEF